MFLTITKLTFIMYLGTLYAQNTVRIEPPNWWMNMPLDTIQLLCYGDGIGAAEVVLKDHEAKVIQTHTADSPNYLFLDLDLSNVSSPRELPVVFKTKGKKAAFNYPIYARMDDGWRPRGFDQSDAIYLITPDRFANGNPANDEIPGLLEGIDRDELFGRHGGDIGGIDAYVPYLDSMGFTAIWSSPVMTNDQPKWSYHGYAITDLYEIDPRMGSLTEYQELSKHLHQRGMKLIMDYIPNHIGDQHWWMEDMPFEDWINHGGEFYPTHHNRNTLHDPYATDHDRKGFTDGWFVESMPDLNQRNTFLAQYLTQNTIWWVETAQLDGLRIDTYPYSDKDFLNAWSCDIKSAYPSLGMVGEEWTTNPNYIAYWQQGNTRNPDGCLESLFDFPLQTAISEALNQEENWNTGWIRLHEALAQDYLYPNAEDLMIFLDNHDMDRFYRQVHKDTSLMKMGLALLLTMRGIPQIYYGTEVLAYNTEGGNHGDIRSHFPGTWEMDTSDARKAASLTIEQRSIQSYLHRLLQFRKTSKAIQDGRSIQFVPEKGVYSFARIWEEDVVLVILNKEDETKLIDAKTFVNELPALIELEDLITGSRVSFNQMIELAPRTAMILTGGLHD